MHKLVHHQRNVGEHHYYAIKGSEGIRWCEVEREESIFTTAKRGYPREDFLKVAKARKVTKGPGISIDSRGNVQTKFVRNKF
jgi:hypothetical protein